MEAELAKRDAAMNELGRKAEALMKANGHG
jgi:hypothetical protein